VSTPGPLSEALQNLTAFIDAGVVAQGAYFVVRGNAVRELGERAGRVVDATAAFGERQRGDALEQACHEASRLRDAANGAFSGCIDVRLETPPMALRRLLERAACEAASGADQNLTATVGQRNNRDGPARAQKPAGRTARSGGRRRVPKHVEMRGKAVELAELIHAETEDHAGRTITKMCQVVGVSRETFQKSRHFAAARAAWQALKAARMPHDTI
jgi:hypothetical protein